MSQGEPPRGATPRPGPSGTGAAPVPAAPARASDQEVDRRKIAQGTEPPQGGIEAESGIEAENGEGGGNGEGWEIGEGYASRGPGQEPAEEGYQLEGVDIAGYGPADDWGRRPGTGTPGAMRRRGEDEELSPEATGAEGAGAEGYGAEEGYEGTEGYEPEYGLEGEYAPGYDEEGAGPAAEDLGAPPVVVGRRRHRVLKGVGALVVVLLVAGLLGFVHISNEVNPPGKPGRTVTVVIPGEPRPCRSPICWPRRAWSTARPCSSCT